ncbi:jmjC domain-containing protein 8 isoform X2 [Microcebus murinus]|uniref:jmjC domain-containing protein 8 isoform X2 n=1 Tax=Microcebus murinus TaxID=30608 RepID=UPI003F6CAA50
MAAVGAGLPEVLPGGGPRRPFPGPARRRPLPRRHGGRRAGSRRAARRRAHGAGAASAAGALGAGGSGSARAGGRRGMAAWRAGSGGRGALHRGASGRPHLHGVRAALRLPQARHPPGAHRQLEVQGPVLPRKAVGLLWGESGSAEHCQHLLLPESGSALPGVRGAAAAPSGPHLPGQRFGIAGAGSGVPFHWHGPGYSEVIYGRKRWFLYPPEKTPEFHPNKTTLAWLRDTYSALAPHARPLECTVRAGEVLYFPDRWWHATLNLDTSVFISTFLG